MKLNPDPDDIEATLIKIQEQSSQGNFRITQHAHQEMVEENISLNDVLEAIQSGRILENYPEHRRGPCCLLYGETGSESSSSGAAVLLTQGGLPIRRHLHIVCTTTREMLIIITVYEAKSPKWKTPTQRNGS
ncbi:DUF4258 domain-containing protein [Candidatus Acetothermia bacterium]|nr:DUF4258 domain-containing protein [Candidatus Acetothermia bacterium]MBI3642691.1 DUF4258 domain-containing protein [Candidatus Acetothermia bacterium]